MVVAGDQAVAGQCEALAADVLNGGADVQMRTGQDAPAVCHQAWICAGHH